MNLFSKKQNFLNIKRICYTLRMIKSLQLGNKIFPINLIQGPLAGVSCAPFRKLTWQYGNPAFSCTEMISCKTLLHQPKKRFTYKDPQEGPVCFQLSSSDPKELGLATKIATDLGADLVDLNCGCPVGKIRRKGAGSSLLSKPLILFNLIEAMKSNTHLPVSIKIRVEGNSNEKFNSELVKVVNDSEVDFLVVHGRHWTERYDIPCRYDDIQYFVENTKIPVIGNGDVNSIDSLKKMFATGCAGVMIGRAGVGQPWLIQQLITELNNEPFFKPAPQKIANIFIDHINDLIDLLGNEKFALLQARKLAKYYARDLMNRMEFCSAINACSDFNSFRTICLKSFTF